MHRRWMLNSGYYSICAGSLPDWFDGSNQHRAQAVAKKLDTPTVGPGKNLVRQRNLTVIGKHLNRRPIYPNL